MKKIFSALIRGLSKITGRKNLENFFIHGAKSLDVDLHKHGLLQMGAGTNVYLENGSEVFFIKNILTKFFAENKNPLFFDVGANIGNYTLSLKQHISNAEVYSFEPVKDTFDQLKINVGDNGKLYNIGLGNLPGKGLLYNSSNNQVSEIATTHKDILTDVFKNTDDIIAIEFEIDTIDNFCLATNIKAIDFLKIDVEGNELQVLKGAAAMLANNAIKVIQFEFNTHNVYARVFLRDFYLLLQDFEFYRLKHNGIVNLGSYNPANEIFTAQNIVAVHKTVIGRLERKYLLTV